MRLPILAAVMAALSHPTSSLAYDTLIRGGTVIDGTGARAFTADVAISNGRIVAIGVLTDSHAPLEIDARGKWVVPGFIDMHSHADDQEMGSRGLRSKDPMRRAAPNLVGQGITTALVNPDGDSPDMDIATQAAALEHGGIGINVALLVGHNTVRRKVMATDAHRPATPDEIERMRALLQQGLSRGAFGLSAGLEYEPGRWSETSELIALAKELAAHDAIYTVHQRSEGSAPAWWRPSRDAGTPPVTFVDAVRETIQIGEQSGATVIASHLKARGIQWWGSSDEIVSLIESARTRGVHIFADQYVYNTSYSDGYVLLLPNWALGLPDGQAEDARPRQDYAARIKKLRHSAQLRADIEHEIAFRGGASNIRVITAPRADWVGQSLQQLADQNKVDVVEMAIRWQLQGDPRHAGGVSARSYSLSDSDVQKFMSRDWVATSTDADIVLPEDGPTHPRFYGNYVRKLEHYALSQHTITPEQAIRAGTTLPAQILGLPDRGRIAPGYAADLVVLDPAMLYDRSTVEHSHEFPTGVEYVFVNGHAAVEAGKRTNSLTGLVLRHLERQQRRDPVNVNQHVE